MIEVPSATMVAEMRELRELHLEAGNNALSVAAVEAKQLPHGAYEKAQDYASIASVHYKAAQLLSQLMPEGDHDCGD